MANISIPVTKFVGNATETNYAEPPRYADTVLNNLNIFTKECISIAKKFLISLRDGYINTEDIGCTLKGFLINMAISTIRECHPLIVCQNKWYTKEKMSFEEQEDILVCDDNNPDTYPQSNYHDKNTKYNVNVLLDSLMNSDSVRPSLIVKKELSTILSVIENKKEWSDIFKDFDKMCPGISQEYDESLRDVLIEEMFYAGWDLYFEICRLNPANHIKIEEYYWIVEGLPNEIIEEINKQQIMPSAHIDSAKRDIVKESIAMKFNSHYQSIISDIIRRIQM